MEPLSTEQVAAAFTEVLRDRLSRRQEAHIPKLGTFRVLHEISQIQEGEDGSIHMKPPRDVIAFSPEE